MIATGTLINTAGIILGGLSGHLFGKLLKKNHQEALTSACGISVLFIGIAGAMEGMLRVEDGILQSSQTMLITICLALGTLLGEFIDIEGKFELFGEWLKVKSGNARDKEFVNAFLTASLTVCIGAMAIVGAIQDGILGDWSILATKAILDFIIIMVMTCSMGKGCVYSAIPVFIFEGSITLLSSFLKPIMNDLAMTHLSLIGSILIFCVGINLLWGKKLRVANMLPSVILAVLASLMGI